MIQMIDEPFYSGMESMYERAARWITQPTARSVRGALPENLSRYLRDGVGGSRRIERDPISEVKFPT